MKTMAQSVYYYYYLFILSLLTIQAATAHYHLHQQQQGLRSLHFSLYQHETLNKTSFIVGNGAAGTGTSQTATPFGTIVVFRDNITITPDKSSRVVGLAEGTSFATSFDGLQWLSMSKFTLNIDGYEGSVSILGSTYNLKAVDDPIVGGTGDFLFAQGFVRSSPADLQGFTVVYKMEFFIYWPPYAQNVPVISKSSY